MKEIFSPMALDRAYLGPDGVIPDGLSTSLGRTKGFLFGEGHVEESLPQCPLNSVTSIRSGSRRVEAGYQAAHLFSWLWETFLDGLSLGIPSILIQLADDEALSSTDLPNSMMYFTKEQFVVGLHLPIHSLFKQFLHFTQIPSVFLHPNVVRVLMGCSVLDMLFQLDLSLLEVLFIYTVKMNQKERVSRKGFLHPTQQAVRDRRNRTSFKASSSLVSNVHFMLKDLPFYEVARLVIARVRNLMRQGAHFFRRLEAAEIMKTYVVHNMDENEDLLASLEKVKSEAVATQNLAEKGIDEEKEVMEADKKKLKKGCPDETGVAGSPGGKHGIAQDTPSFPSDDEETFLGYPA
ncbi:hypothetical protein CK203_106569 [Vitis vinifera]|uniref:Uncharacterized protein n=1 Tax=Vitis vinifera TaxID=29760 RepID=A0A438DVD8_VITVI|nr:hypothetical protein CK203_106569 [Vitis vinifera]